MKDEKLRSLVDLLGAFLLTTEPPDQIEIPRAAAAEIVAILSSLPAGKVGRPKKWTAETEICAIFGMLGDVPVNKLARQIAKETGQPMRSAQRRLRALKKSPQFTNWTVR